MHVLMISDVYFPRINGVSTSIATFRQSPATLGVRTTLVAPEYNGLADTGADSTADAAHTIRVPAWEVPLDREDRIMRPGALAGVMQGLDADAIDLVHVQTPFLAHRAGVRYARRNGLPVLETYHTHFEEYFQHYLPWLPRCALKWAARGISRRQCNSVDAVIAPSPAMREMLGDYGVESPIEILPTGLDVSLFARGDGERFRRKHGIATGRPVMLIVSRVAHEKNIEFLIDVVDLVRRELPDVLLVIAGEGPADAHLRSSVHERRLAGNVLFVGYLDRHGALQDCYRASDLFVFASRSETQGLVLLEALALGVPVLALAVLGTREIVLPQRGAVAAPDDVSRFATHAVALLRDRPRRERLSVEARAFAREWETSGVAQRLREIYRTIPSRRDRSHS